MPTAKSVDEILQVRGDVNHQDWITKSATDQQLEEYISRVYANQVLLSMSTVELEKRRFKKLSTPHWTLSWGFLVIVIAAIFGAISAWPIIQGWFPHAPSGDKAASSQLPQSHLEPATVATQQLLPVLPLMLTNTNALNQKSH